MTFRQEWEIFKYRVNTFVFTWNAEDENEGSSIVFTVCKVIHFLKYKESTLIYFGKHPEFKQARKFVAAFKEN